MRQTAQRDTLNETSSVLTVGLKLFKTSAMDFNFDVACDTDLLKSQIYLHMHPTCIETILNFCFEEILCVTLAVP
jgi:hypothetical protein